MTLSRQTKGLTSKKAPLTFSFKKKNENKNRNHKDLRRGSAHESSFPNGPTCWMLDAEKRRICGPVSF